MFKRIKNLFASKQSAATRPHVAIQQSADDVLINAYLTKEIVPTPNFPHVLHARRDRSDPELLKHLNGFIGYASNRGNGEMSHTRYHVIRHIQRVQQHLSLTLKQGELNAYAEWANEFNALAFLADGSIRDPAGRILLSADGSSDPEAEIPYPVEAWQRKTRTEILLSTKGIKISASLPPLVSETELRLRSRDAVAGRALALFVVAVRAESLTGGDPLAVDDLHERFPSAARYLTPKELAFLAQAAPTQTEIVQFAWCYECLFALEWALGWIETLAYPAAICDVPLVARIIAGEGGDERRHTARLRPAGEILDALDMHYRLHWLVRQTQVDGQDVPSGLEAGVILERHRAFNWLVCFEDKDWDRVDVPT